MCEVNLLDCQLNVLVGKAKIYDQQYGLINACCVHFPEQADAIRIFK